MSNRIVNTQWLDAQTRDMDDTDFSAAVQGVIAIRRARNAGTLEARQMAAATLGVSLSPEYAYRTRVQRAAEADQQLHNSYVRAGLSHAEASAAIRALR